MLVVHSFATDDDGVVARLFVLVGLVGEILFAFLFFLVAVFIPDLAGISTSPSSTETSSFDDDFVDFFLFVNFFDCICFDVTGRTR